MTNTAAADRFFSKAPTLIGRVAGIRFYEHPTQGDEMPLVAIVTAEGINRVALTCFWDLPDAGEALDWLSTYKRERGLH